MPSEWRGLPSTHDPAALWPRRRALPAVLGLYALLGGLVSFLGWALDIPRLTAWDNNGISIQPNACVCAALSGLALVMLAFSRRQMAAALGVIVAFIGGATLLEWLSGWNLGIDSLLMLSREWGRGGVVLEGRMGPPGCTSWTLIGVGLLLSALGVGKIRRVVPIVGLIALAISLVSITSYLYGAGTLHTLPHLTVIALQTATFILAISVGLIASVPELQPMRGLLEPSAAGIMSRRALPVIVLVALGLGGLRVAGQNAGLFDTALGTTLRTVVEIILLVGLLWWALKRVRIYESAMRDDFTARQYAEGALRVKEKQLQHVTDNAGVIMAQCSRDFRYRFVNRTCAEFLKRPVSEIVGQPVSEIMGEAAFKAILPYVERALCGERVEYEAEIPYSALGPRWMRVIYVPDVDISGRVVGWIASATDLTERKRTELVRARLAAIVESSDDAIVSKDLEGVITSWNAGAEQLFGYTAAEAIGQNITMLIPPDFVDEEPGILATIRRGESVDHYETVRRQKDGTLVDVSLTVSPMRDGSGRIVGASKIARDITQRKRTDDALHQSRKRMTEDLGAMTRLQAISTRLAHSRDMEGLLREILAAAAGFTGTDKGNIQFYNPETGKLRIVVHQGLGRRLIEHFAEDGWVATCTEAATRVERIIVEDVTELKSLCGTLEMEIVLEDGIRAIQCTPLVSRGGRLLGMLNNHYATPGGPDERQLRLLDVLARMAADLIERRQADEAIRQSEQHFREMIDALPAAVYTTDAQGRVTHFNPAAVALSGRTPELGTDRWCVSWKLFHADGTPMPHETCPMALALKQGRVVRGIEAIAERPDGSRVWFEPYPTPLRDEDGTIVGGINMLVDITNRKQAEQALRDSETRFRTMANSIPAIIWTADSKGVITFHNQQWMDYTGVDAADNDWARRVLHPDDYERCIAAWTEALERGSEYEIEVRNQRWDGEYRWFLTRATPIRDEAGRLVEWYGSTTDIHDRKKAEEALREADRRKDEFLATLAHELRNPLAPIRSAVAILATRESSEPAHAGVGEVIDRHVVQMARLLDDLLDVSRITRDKLDLRRERLDLKEVIHTAIETIRPMNDGAGHQLHVNLPSESIIVDGDPLRIGQAIGNLLANACKYTEPGGEITLTAERQGSDAVVSVSDTGIGIPPDKIDRIFDMFSQLDRSLERERGGLGIGLHLVKRLVEMHGGSVQARSDGVGKGSEFVVRLPCVAAGAVRSQPKPRPARGAPPVDQAHHRILIVDDNQDTARTLARLLQLRGHHTAIAHDGYEAIEKAEAEKPDVVVLDIGLPKLDGYKACRSIRCKLAPQRPLMIAVSGWGRDDDRQKSAEAGFDAHLVKPIDYVDLLELLNSRSEGSRPADSALTASQ